MLRKNLWKINEKCWFLEFFCLRCETRKEFYDNERIIWKFLNNLCHAEKEFFSREIFKDQYDQSCKRIYLFQQTMAGWTFISIKIKNEKLAGLKVSVFPRFCPYFVRISRFYVFLLGVKKTLYFLPKKSFSQTLKKNFSNLPNSLDFLKILLLNDWW